MRERTLSEQLRAHADFLERALNTPGRVEREAADEIDRLNAKMVELEGKRNGVTWEELNRRLGFAGAELFEARKRLTALRALSRFNEPNAP